MNQAWFRVQFTKLSLNLIQISLWKLSKILKTVKFSLQKIYPVLSRPPWRWCRRRVPPPRAHQCRPGLWRGEGSGGGQRASRAGRRWREECWDNQQPTCPSGRRCPVNNLTSVGTLDRDSGRDWEYWTVLFSVANANKRKIAIMIWDNDSPQSLSLVMMMSRVITLTSLLSGLLTIDSAIFWSIKNRRERGKPSIMPARITLGRFHLILNG